MGDDHWAGARASLPLALAVGGFGVSFGVLARSAGMGRLAPVVMSATTFAGSAQFAAVSVLGAGGTLAAAVTAAVLLNTRYAPIGLTVAPALAAPRWKRLLVAQLVVDESWAIGHLGEGRYSIERTVGAGLVLYGAWLCGTTVGVLSGHALGDPARLGLDAAFPALFLALLAPNLSDRRAWAAALLGSGVALALLPLAPAGVPVIAAALPCLLGLRPPSAGGGAHGEAGAGPAPPSRQGGWGTRSWRRPGPGRPDRTGGPSREGPQ